VEIDEKEVAEKFFETCWKAHTLSVLDANFEEKFQRDMRVYLVKSEADFTTLAIKRYLEEVMDETK
jgi:hypothetical protein